MNSLKDWIPELALDTLVAVILSVVFWLVGVDKTPQQSVTTFVQVFLVMFLLGAYYRYKKKSNKNK